MIPRLVFIPYLLTRFIFLFVRFGRRNRSIRNDGIFHASICIEAGIRGWNSIEFKELYSSACEYLESNMVHKIQISHNESYLRQVKRSINNINPTHYLYDPRTGSQKWFIGLWQSLYISVLLHFRGIIPIVLLTDLSIRTWRAQSGVVTAKSGTMICFMAPRKIYPIFPHRRLVGPSLMPFSEATMDLISAQKVLRTANSTNNAIFIGSLYEPRTSILKEIAAGLESRGLSIDIKGRELGAQRIPDSEYWSRIVNAALVFTTADQAETRGADWTWISHMIYRYLEVIACGTLLVAPEVPGINRYFLSGKHFVSFNSPAHAVDVIEYYLVHEKERNMIAQQGKDRSQALISARTFWTGIDVGLGIYSLT